EEKNIVEIDTSNRCGGIQSRTLVFTRMRLFVAHLPQHVQHRCIGNDTLRSNPVDHVVEVTVVALSNWVGAGLVNSERILFEHTFKQFAKLKQAKMRLLKRKERYRLARRCHLLGIL